VRNRDEVDAWQIDGPGVELVHVPYMRFVSAMATGGVVDLVDPDESYVAVCPRGAESAEVAAALTEAGVETANLAGGMEGWARVYRRTRIARDATDATVYQYRRPATGCLASVVVSDGEAPRRRPVVGVRRPLRRRRRRNGRRWSRRRHRDGRRHARPRGTTSAAFAPWPGPPVRRRCCRPVPRDRGVTGDVTTVDDGDAITVGDHELDVLRDPGHTTGSVSLRLDDVVFTGDTLFLDGAPRP